MKILVAIPFLYGATPSRECIESVINLEGVDVLPLLNGAAPDVRQVVNSYSYSNKWGNTILNRDENIYVTAAWNLFIEMFLDSDYTHLIIMNSDLIMGKGWQDVLKKRWAVNPDEVLLPVIRDNSMELLAGTTDISNALEVHEGTPGVFITLNKKQAGMVYPIPSDIKVWFNDTWIYAILRRVGFKTLIPENLLAYHYWSTSVTHSAIHAIIEDDKILWDKVVRKLNSPIFVRYNHSCYAESDIHEHLPVLYRYALQCSAITEFGTRRGVSTLAFLSACINRDAKVTAYDIVKWEDVDGIIELAKQDGLNFTFKEESTLTCDIETTDLLFIDTYHTYSQLKAELDRHAGKVNKFIAFHDTFTYGENGEPSYEAVAMNAMNCGRGIWKAIEEFMQANPEWSVCYKTDSNNGLTILAKKQ